MRRQNEKKNKNLTNNVKNSKLKGMENNET